MITIIILIKNFILHFILQFLILISHSLILDFFTKIINKHIYSYILLLLWIIVGFSRGRYRKLN